MSPNDCHDKYILMIEINLNVISNLRHNSDSSKKKIEIWIKIQNKQNSFFRNTRGSALCLFL